MAPRRSDGPDPIGDPPGDLQDRRLPLVSHTGILYRIHWLDDDPMRFGKGKKWRFDDPLGKCGVLYAAQTPDGAFAETLLPPPGVLTSTMLLSDECVPVSARAIETHGLAEIACRSPITCVDLTGEHLASIGADASIATGSWSVSQRWSRALFAHPAKPDALLYRSRRDRASLALAIQERARSKMAVTPLGGLLESRHIKILARIVARYHVAIVPG